jgi:hypothetical protein
MTVMSPSQILYHLRHLRFLLRSAEDLIEKPPTLNEIQNEATATKAEIKAIQSELASTVQKQALDHASLEEEKDGRTNEK